MWIQTYTGKKINPLNPHIEEIDIVDIAHSLSLICRYNGHCNRFYSVAEHSVMGTIELEKYLENKNSISCIRPLLYSENDIKTLQKQFLLHDATESYICDVPRPIKGQLSNYKEIEHDLSKIIFEKFNLEYPYSSEVKTMDNIMLFNEAKLLFNDISEWGGMDTSWNIRQENFNFYSPSKIKTRFLEIYIHLFEN